MTTLSQRYCCQTDLKTFTVTILHNCNKCKYCKATVTFYDKSKSCSEFQGIDMNAIDSAGKRRYFGIISYFSYLSPIFYPSPSKMKSKQGSRDGSDEVEERPDLRPSVISYYQLANQFTHRMLVAKLKNEKLRHKEAKASSENDSTYSSDSCEKTVEKNSPKRSTVSSIFTEVVLKAKYKTNEKEKNDTKQATSGTLKRKRGNLERLKSQNDYEDDLYESQSLYVINVVEDDPISSDDCNIKTPELDPSVSPPEWSESSSFEDCISPTDLRNFRKEAEEYQYRRSKRRKYMNVSNKMEEDSSSEMEAEKDSSSEMEAGKDSVYETLVETSEKLSSLKSERDVGSDDEDNSDDDEDNYDDDEEDNSDEDEEDNSDEDEEDNSDEDEETDYEDEDDEKEKKIDEEEERIDDNEEEKIADNDEKFVDNEEKIADGEEMDDEDEE